MKGQCPTLHHGHTFFTIQEGIDGHVPLNPLKRIRKFLDLSLRSKTPYPTFTCTSNQTSCISLIDGVTVTVVSFIIPSFDRVPTGFIIPEITIKR